MSELKKPTISVFVALLETLSEQGFIDMEPTEGEYDCTCIYDFLIVIGIAGRPGFDKYWLKLINPVFCTKLLELLKNLEK
jgi:hypothetical protein